ncbi:chromatin-remodeling complex subunit ies6 [Cryomyces antarcticus]|uniref:Chromatin-remodeling complex subunit ies6 n=1 Tax=Cryomyces antarcticus TaxID=329879 RepID=A0ABR0KU44_9PEZI|nr:chromatin-remodeling complex subunit ies6 [Cryomyces antarcticus]KAK5130886.1 chromatin-remodeling complex subunit ies6 [Cryomyces antarcticus]
MAPTTLAAASIDGGHDALLNQLDIYAVSKPWRKPHWKPPQRRNKTVKQAIDASRRDATNINTQANSGASTPFPPASGSAATPLQLNPAEASEDLSRLVLSKRMQAALSVGPKVEFEELLGAPSIHPSSKKRYCDITSQPAPYTDPKTKLRYHNREVYGYIQRLSGQDIERLLELHQEPNERPPHKDEDDSGDKGGSAFQLLAACEEAAGFLEANDHGQAGDEEDLKEGVRVRSVRLKGRLGSHFP